MTEIVSLSYLFLTQYNNIISKGVSSFMMSHRQYDFKSHKRNTYKKRNIESIREKAEENRDLAYAKKYGNSNNKKEYQSQEDYLNKYFIMK
jgi:hypothetical protein